MKGKIIGIKPMGSHESCLKCGKIGSHIAYSDNGDGLLHAENLCDSCIGAAIDLYILDAAHQFKEEVKLQYEESIMINNK
jgi:hypothetical protein